MPARRMGHKPVRRGSAPADLMPSHVEGIVILGVSQAPVDAPVQGSSLAVAVAYRCRAPFRRHRA